MDIFGKHAYHITWLIEPLNNNIDALKTLHTDTASNVKYDRW